MTIDTGALSIGRGSQPTATKGTLDEQLIARIAGGNRLAMRVLFARFNERVFRFALRLTDDTGLAEDVVSEVFFEVWRKAATFEGRSQVSTWILGITRNKALDARKARSTDGWDEEVAFQKNDLRAVMRKCLAQLSPTHREIIDLVYYHGKSIDEIARLTGAGQATVKTRMFYARKHLAELLGAYGITTAAA
jgi:RNA polymerase sigma-70 factor (ECF subfamily)